MALSPIIVATLQATVLSAISNVLAQGIQAYKTTGNVVGTSRAPLTPPLTPSSQAPYPLDVGELSRFVILTILTAPPNYKWQQFLERSFPAYRHRPSTVLPLTSRAERQSSEDKREPPPPPPPYSEHGAALRLSIRNTLLKWFIDCITCGALMNTSAFLVLMGLLKGQAPAQIATNLQHETWPIIFASYKVWPVASLVSFSFVPVERRIVFLSTIGLCWGIYMSMVAARV